MTYIREGKNYRPTRLEIYTDKIRKNYRTIRSLIDSNCQIMSVVKANAYSLGALRISSILEEEGCHSFAVATVEEGLELRQAGIGGDILVLTTMPEAGLAISIEQELSISCGNLDLAKKISKEAYLLGKTAKVHIKVDTGLGRTGFFPEKVLASVRSIREMVNIDICGIYSHFAVADEKDSDYTHIQFEKFIDCIDQLKKEHIKIPLQHICNSPAIINFPSMQLNCIRPGKLLYGLPWSYEETTPTEPVFSLKSEISSVRELPKGSALGYGLKYITKRDQKIGIVPIGFYDGFSRLYKTPQVLVRGVKIPVVGNVCMDQTMIDLTDVPDSQVGDEVVIIGTQGGQSISTNDLRKDLDTISTQILSMISNRVPRIYI